MNVTVKVEVEEAENAREREREKIEKVRIMREGGWRCPERWSWVGES